MRAFLYRFDRGSGSLLSSPRHSFAALPFLLLAACTSASLDTVDEGASAEEVDAHVSELSAPNDPKFSLQWGLRNTGQTVPTNEDGEVVNVKGTKGLDLNVLSAWDVSQGSASVVVAVIEENDIEIGHPDLRDNIFVNTREVAGDGIDNDGNGYIDDVSGVDFIDRDGMNGPFVSHGAHVAGIIAARTGNALGVAGVAPLVKVLPLRAESSSASMVEAINYAKRTGAKVVNVSQGGWFDYSLNVYNAIRDSGMLFVCSAGNDGTAKYNYPSGYDLSNVISVANVNPAGALARLSSYGEAHVDIAAPGKGVLSTVSPGGYDYMDGTSQSAPHVAGVAALLWSKYPTLTIADVVNRILSSGIKMSTLRGVVKSGSMVDAGAALVGTAPITLNATSVPGKITLSWNAQSGASRYDVERDGSLTSVSAATYTHSSLPVDSAHVYRVRAVVGSTPGLWSRKLYATASTEPTQETVSGYASAHPYAHNRNEGPKIFKRNAKRMRVHFSRLDIAPGDYLWYAPTNLNRYDLNKLDGSYPTGFWTHWVGDTFDFAFHSDASGNAWGYDVDKIEYVLGVPDVPSTPYVMDIGPGYVWLAWTPTGGCLTSNVYRSTSSSSGYTKLASVPAPTGDYNNTGLTAGRTYYYKVSCQNDLGESPLSAFVKVITQ
ncbi:MAG: S8 family serine peptidase [Myxococcota bacterium]